MNLKELIVRQSADFMAVNMLIFYQNRTSSLVLQERPLGYPNQQEGPAIGV